MNQSSSKALDWLASFSYQTDQGQLFKLTTKIKDKVFEGFFNECKSKPFEKNHVSSFKFNQLATYNVGSFHIQRLFHFHKKILLEKKWKNLKNYTLSFCQVSA